MNHVINLKKQYDKVAILDMDIANPYFRSRERQEFLEDMGITIHFNSFGYDITEDLPAISACMKCCASGITSSVRSRSGGMSIVITAKR